MVMLQDSGVLESKEKFSESKVKIYSRSYVIGMSFTKHRVYVLDEEAQTVVITIESDTCFFMQNHKE